MSKMPERGKERGRPFKSMGHHNKFLSRITKSLYYGKLPKTERLSLPVSELASELFSEAQQGHSLNRLYCDDVANITRNACVSPCSFVLALLYLERLKNCNPEYLRQVAPSKLFLISLMVSSKFLHDDGEDDEVFSDEWAKCGEITVSELCQSEKEFLGAIDWNVFVREPLFWERLEKLESQVALREGSKRGWFTYTEIKYISTAYEITNLLQTLVAISAVLAATYAVGLMTLAGSIFLTSRIPFTSLHSSVKTLDITSNSTTEMAALNTKQMAALTTEQMALVDDPINTNLTEMDLIISQAMNEVRSETKTHFKTLDAVNVLKTSFILASICQSDLTDTSDVTNQPEVGYNSWDWWNNPIMQWLSDVSKSNEYLGVKLPHNYYKNFAHDKLVDMSIARQKKLNLEDKIHKATKVRLQEQMERSWHEEWTDSVFMTLRPYFSQISAY